MAKQPFEVSNLAQFNRDIEIEKRTPARVVLDTQKFIAQNLLERIVNRTPVGNPDQWKSKRRPKGYVGGRARANWQVSFGAPDSSELNARDKNGGATISRGTAEIQAVTIPYRTIWIFNNVPYIVRLENGWSKQTPPGVMVRLSVLEVESGFA
jgi:hypothetical protein